MKTTLILISTLLLTYCTSSVPNDVQNNETKFKRDFFNQVEPIKLVDPLAFALGASDAGEPFIYHYTDIITYSGHSCPALAGGYKMSEIALKNYTEIKCRYADK